MNRISFERCVAIVTGAGNGLGRDYAIALASRGASVAVNDVGAGVDGTGTSKQAADLVVETIRLAGGTAIASYESVATAAGARLIVQATIAAFGRVDILINNAGNRRSALLAEFTEDDAQSIMDTHLLGACYMTQAAFRAMQKQGYGRMIFTSSSGGAFGIESRALYGAAKAGVLGLMHVAAIEGKPFGILCNAVLPSAATRMSEASKGDGDVTPEIAAALQTFAGAMKPEFVSPLVLYLASERCRTTHGIYSATGGRYARAFIGLAPGWLGPIDRPATCEEIEEHWPKIEDTLGFIVPSHVLDELVSVGRARSDAAKATVP